MVAAEILGGHIRLLAPLGAGGMGTVWLGRDEMRGTPVAVKLMRPAIAAMPDAVARFGRELRILSRLRDAAGPRLLDRGEHDGIPFAVMDRVEGESLDKKLAAGPLALRVTGRIVSMLLTRLAAVHAAGIVHRDIKPSNIMVGGSESDPSVSLVDFGIATASNEPDITEEGATVGTPYYMSPEQIFRTEPVDARADLWSAAVVAYQCLTGRLPFKGATFGATCVAVHDGTFPPVSESRSDVTEAIDAWFASALSTRPEDRFESATEMEGAWSAAIEGKVLSRAEPERTRWSMRAIAVALVLIAGAGCTASAATSLPQRDTVQQVSVRNDWVDVLRRKL
jgi:serine/threonine-protein kinase